MWLIGKRLCLFLFFILLIVQLSFAQIFPEKHIIGTEIQKTYPKIDSDIFSADDDTINIIIQADDDNLVIGVPYLKEVRKFDLGNFYFARIPKSEVNKLENMPAKRVWLEKHYNLLLNVSAPLINATTFWSNGYNGTGIKVCVIDTGINKTHPALNGRIIAEKDFVIDDSDGNSTADFNGHGTHVAGIVASSDLTYRGVAFGASILNAKVFNSNNPALPEAPVSAIINATDWCISQGAHILTLSLGGKDELNDGSDALSQYVDLAVDQGKIVTIAAGNSGPNGGKADCRTARDPSGASYSVCTPGLAHKVITIGSTSKTDLVSGFSSRGPTGDGRIKPDVMAPGESITSAAKNGGFVALTGTSMSTPHVAGLAALILQVRSMAPEEVKALLMDTAIDFMPAGKDNVSGAGRVNGSRIFDEINNTIRNTTDSVYKAHNIFVPAGSKEIRATLYWPENYSQHNDLDLYLLDPAGNVRANSISAYNTDEMIRLSNPEPAGNWKLLVNPFNVSGAQPYALASNFKPLQKMNIATGNISGVAYHQINVSQSSIINLDWNSSSDNLDLYLYDKDGNLVASSVSNNTNNESVLINENAFGSTRLAKIVPVNLSSTIKYSLMSVPPISQQIIDDLPPVVTMSEPLNKTYNTQTINLDFNVSDNVNLSMECYRILDNVSVFISSFKIGLASTNFSISDGTHSIYVTCKDDTGNTGASPAVNFFVDATLPSITFVPPSDIDNVIVNRNYTFINITIFDAGSVDSCSIEWGSSTLQVMSKIATAIGDVNCFLDRNDTDGIYVYRVLANDSASNLAFITRTITFDTTKPVIIDNKPKEEFIKNLQVNFTINYTEINLDNVTLYWRNSSVDVYSHTTFANCPSGTVSCSALINLSGSVIEFFFNITDKAGNSVVSQQSNLTLDTTKPNVSIQLPLNTTYDVFNITLNFTASDSSGISQCNYELNGAQNVTIPGNTTFLGAEGSDVLRVYCNDTAGNIGSASVNFTVKALPTAFAVFSGGVNNIFSPNGDGVYDTITANITASEIVRFGTTFILAQNGSKVDRFNSPPGGINVTSILRTWNGSCNSDYKYCVGIAPDGEYIIQVNMTDMEGNRVIVNMSETIIIDTTPMQLSFTEPTPNNVTLFMSNSVTINVITSEPASSASLEWSGRNESMSGSGTNWFAVKTNLIDGNYTFRVHVFDILGNKNSSAERWVFVNVTRNLTSFLNNTNQTLSLQNVSVVILNSNGSLADAGSLISFNNYILLFNASNILVITDNFVLNNLNLSAAVNVTNKIPDESDINATFNQSGGVLDSYVWVDINLLSPGNYTAKITFPRTYALYFYLNETADNIQAIRIKNVCNATASNTPCYNISGSTSTIFLPSFSGAAAGNDIQAPSLNLISPTATTYNSSSIPLTYTVSDNVTVDRCWFKLNSGSNVTLSNCQNTTIIVSEGPNTLIVSVNDTSGNLNQKTVTFTFTPTTGPTPSPAPSPGGGTNTSPIAQNQTNITAIIQQSNQAAVPTTQESPEIAPLINETTNQTGETNQTSVTGLVIGSPTSLIIGFALIVAILLAWRFMKARKRRAKRRVKIKARPKTRLTLKESPKSRAFRTKWRYEYKPGRRSKQKYKRKRR